MDSISPCSKSAWVLAWRKPARTRLLALASLVFAILLAWFPVPTWAEGANIVSATLEAGEDGLQLEADIELQLPAHMREAVRKGVPLYFTVDFELTKSRWYWLDEAVVRVSRTRRVGYAPLTDQYRLTVSGVSQNVNSIEEVTRALSRVRSWTVLEKGRLKPGEKYDAAIRFRLDTSQLPKPFQINLLTSKEWTLNSDWYRFSVVGEAKP